VTCASSSAVGTEPACPPALAACTVTMSAPISTAFCACQGAHRGHADHPASFSRAIICLPGERL
jgi:hypothetical protein